MVMNTRQKLCDLCDLCAAAGKNNEKQIIQVRLTDCLTFIDSAGSGGVRSFGPLQELYKSDRGLLLSVSRFEMLRDASRCFKSASGASATSPFGLSARFWK
jgi:hypothetical protein